MASGVDITREPVARALYCAGPCSAVTVAAWLEQRDMPMDAAAAPKRLRELEDLFEADRRHRQPLVDYVSRLEIMAPIPPFEVLP